MNRRAIYKFFAVHCIALLIISFRVVLAQVQNKPYAIFLLFSFTFINSLWLALGVLAAILILDSVKKNFSYA